jgi:uncharacterized protein (PEP-CTERM system associated)
MNCRSWAAVAAILLLPAAAIADPLLSFGPDVPLFITATASVRHDDNVLLTANDKVGDTIYIFAPGIDLHLTGGKATMGVTFSEQFIRYATNSDLDDHLANLAANAGYQGTDLKFNAIGSYIQTDQTTTSATNLNQTVKQSVTFAAINSEASLTAKTKLGPRRSWGSRLRSGARCSRKRDSRTTTSGRFRSTCTTGSRPRPT